MVSWAFALTTTQFAKATRKSCFTNTCPDHGLPKKKKREQEEGKKISQLELLARHYSFPFEPGKKKKKRKERGKSHPGLAVLFLASCPALECYLHLGIPVVHTAGLVSHVAFFQCVAKVPVLASWVE